MVSCSLFDGAVVGSMVEVVVCLCYYVALPGIAQFLGSGIYQAIQALFIHD